MLGSVSVTTENSKELQMFRFWKGTKTYAIKLFLKFRNLKMIILINLTQFCQRKRQTPNCFGKQQIKF